MEQNGRIREYDLSDEIQRKQIEELEKSYKTMIEAKANNLPAKPVNSSPLTSDQARFFKSKGPLFRAIWGKRLSRGLTPTLALQLKGLIDDFVRNEKMAEDTKVF